MSSVGRPHPRRTQTWARRPRTLQQPPAPRGCVRRLAQQSWDFNAKNPTWRRLFPEYAGADRAQRAQQGTASAASQHAGGQVAPGPARPGAADAGEQGLVSASTAQSVAQPRMSDPGQQGLQPADDPAQRSVQQQAAPPAQAGSAPVTQAAQGAGQGSAADVQRSIQQAMRQLRLAASGPG